MLLIELLNSDTNDGDGQQISLFGRNEERHSAVESQLVKRQRIEEGAKKTYDTGTLGSNKRGVVRIS
jgi:hypothetical protein